MKAIILHPSLNLAGGAEKVCLATIKALLKGGYKVKLATVDETNWNLLEKVFGDISRPHEEEFLLKNIPIKNERSKGFLTFLFLFELIHKRLQANEGLTINTYGNLVDPVAHISYIGGIPVRTMHLLKQSGYANQALLRQLAGVYDLYIRNLQKVFRENLLLVNSRFIKGIVKRYLNRNSIVVYPPVDLDRFFQTSNLSSRDDTVVVISRFKRGKNLDIVPRIAKLAGCGKFVIIGIADLESQNIVNKLMQTIETLGLGQRVELLINQPRQKLQTVLSSSKVYLHTQHMEAFGIAVVEAMAAGAVPLVPRCGGPWLDILNCKQGIYGYSYSSLEEAANIIKKLLKDENHRRNIALKAVQRASNFKSSNFEAKILKIVNHFFGRTNEMLSS